MDVSIIIVNYKTPLMVCDCIRSVFEKTEGVDFEVIVVDNHSEDSIDLMLQKAFGDRVKRFMLEENLGFGQANNKGLEAASGRNILFLNPDTLLINNAVKALCDLLDTHADIGACGGNLYDAHMQPTHSFRRLLPGILWELNEMTAHRIERLAYRGSWTFNHTQHPLDVAYIAGADLMVRRAVLDEVGAFSPAFFMYNEDTDLCLRIHQARHRIVSLPNAQIQHLEGASTRHSQGADIPRGILLSEQGRQRYYHKNVGRCRRTLAEAVYRWGLYQSWMLGLLSGHPSAHVFKQRIDAIHQLNTRHP